VRLRDGGVSDNKKLKRVYMVVPGVGSDARRLILYRRFWH